MAVDLGGDLWEDVRRPQHLVCMRVQHRLKRRIIGERLHRTRSIEERAEEILEMLSKTNTHIFIAGYEAVRDNLDKAFAKILGSKEQWQTRKSELIAGNKWAEVIY